MLTIVPLANEQAVEWLSKAQVSEGECLAAFEKDTCCGVCVYYMNEQTVELLYLSGDDAGIRDGLLRATLNKALHSGKEMARCFNQDMFGQLLLVGFVKNNKEVTINVGEFFNKNRCQHS